MDMHLSFPEENDPDQFLNKAKRIVQREIEYDMPDEVPYFDIYIVWFSKTLQNWKGMASTSLPDGRYYEVTYNGDKEEAYVDTYEKIVNSRVPDNPTDTNQYERNVRN